jgi:hypothetical protein
MSDRIQNSEFPLSFRVDESKTSSDGNSSALICLCGSANFEGIAKAEIRKEFAMKKIYWVYRRRPSKMPQMAIASSFFPNTASATYGTSPTSHAEHFRETIAKLQDFSKHLNLFKHMRASQTNCP